MSYTRKEPIYALGGHASSMQNDLQLGLKLQTFIAAKQQY